MLVNFESLYYWLLIRKLDEFIMGLKIRYIPPLIFIAVFCHLTHYKTGIL